MEVMMSEDKGGKLVLFDGRPIRKMFHAGEWWFSIIDVVQVLVGGDRSRKYWNDLKRKLLQEGYVEVSEKIGQLKMKSSDGKFYATDCANTETLFRIIQSIPSPKVEPLSSGVARMSVPAPSRPPSAPAREIFCSRARRARSI
jgi:DNA-damage-inducible protein D